MKMLLRANKQKTEVLAQSGQEKKTNKQTMDLLNNQFLDETF